MDGKKREEETERWRDPDSGQNEMRVWRQTKTSAAIKREKETDEMKEGESGMNGSDTNRVKDMAAHGWGTEGWGVN